MCPYPVFSKYPPAFLRFHIESPGKWWIYWILCHSQNFSLKTRTNLDMDRTDSMSPETVKIHFARIHALCGKNDIKNGAQIFNFDESGFSILSMTLGGRRKCIIRQGKKIIKNNLSFAEHVTM